jgi:hypothetical protein
MSDRVSKVEADLAFWRETGARVLAGTARDIQRGPAPSPAAPDEPAG